MSTRRKRVTIPLGTPQIPRDVQVISLPAELVSTSGELLLQEVRLCCIKWTRLQMVCSPCRSMQSSSRHSLLSYCHTISRYARQYNFIHVQLYGPHWTYFHESRQGSTVLTEDLSNEFHENRAINVGSTDRNVLTHLSNVWLFTARIFT